MNNPNNTVDIFIIEDNENDLELTLRALYKHNLANMIKTAEDGAEALDLLFSRGDYENEINLSPKVILLDLKLPKVSGLEVLKELKNNEKTAKIPVVVLTSSKEESDLVESYKLGANSYIVKPVDFNKFIDSIKDIGYYWLLLNQTPER